MKEERITLETAKLLKEKKFDTYEKALEAGLKYALKLIK
jgi:hypothetical protein